MSEVLASALLIFAIRVTEMCLGTLRLLVMVRGMRKLTWVLGFIASGLYILATGVVLSNLDSALKIVGYAAGFATGCVAGMWLETRLALGFVHLNVVSPRQGLKILERVRQAGYAATEVSGIGRDGHVTLIGTDVQRKDEAAVAELIGQADPQAFVYAEDMRPLNRGFWGE